MSRRGSGALWVDGTTIKGANTEADPLRVDRDNLLAGIPVGTSEVGDKLTVLDPLGLSKLVPDTTGVRDSTGAVRTIFVQTAAPASPQVDDVWIA